MSGPESTEDIESDPPEAWVVEPEAKSERLDQWLHLQYPDLSRNFLQKCIGEGQVCINGKVVTKNGFKLTGGETVQILFSAPEPLDVLPEDIPLDIVYQDDSLLVINKPAGLVVHPGAGHSHGTLVNALLFYCHDLSGIGGVERPGIVHRLDKDTTGLLVVAKNDQAHQSLTAQIKSRTMQRRYLALIPYSLPETTGSIEAPIGRHLTDRKRMAVVADGRWARTHWEGLRYFKGYTLVSLKLDTGRTHQIRVHLNYLQRPIVGDQLYGDVVKHPFATRRPLLHACALNFLHPMTGEPLAFSAPLPDDFQAILERLTEIR